MLTKLFLSAALAGLTATAALADVNIGQPLGTEDAAITVTLQEAGYTVTEIDREDGKIEVEATKGGKEYEIDLNAAGDITSIELDD